jgi:hypothetical protein
VFTLGNCKKFIARKQEVLVRKRIDKKEVKEQSKTRKRYPNTPVYFRVAVSVEKFPGRLNQRKVLFDFTVPLFCL